MTLAQMVALCEAGNADPDSAPPSPPSASQAQVMTRDEVGFLKGLAG